MVAPLANWGKKLNLNIESEQILHDTWSNKQYKTTTTNGKSTEKQIEPENQLYHATRGEKYKADEWADPSPIKKTALLPVEKLPDEIIPSQLRLWLKDISHRMQCPIDFMAVGAIVNLSSLVGTRCGVRPKKNDDWTITPNLWGGVVGRPSTKKTPSLNEVLKPIVILGNEAKKEFKGNDKLSMADKEVNKARKAALISDMTAVAKGNSKVKKDMEMLKIELAGLEDQGEPILKRYKTNDSTVEKLGELLRENPRGMLVFRDELMGLLSTLDREDKQGDRAFYLEAWNGNNSYEADRIGRGFIDVPSCCISVLGGIQPSKLLAYLMQSTSALKNDGMMQRFQLLVYPDEINDWQFIDQRAADDVKNRAYDIFDKIDKIDFSLIGTTEENDKYFLRFNNEGYEVFKEWQISERVKVINENENPLIAEHLEKYASMMPSLALIFHLINVVTGEVIEEAANEISESCAIMACGWCKYLESHARRIYGMLSGVGNRRVIELSKKIIKGDLVDGFTIRDIYRKEWQLLDNKESAEDACNELEKLGWIRQEFIPVLNRHPKSIYVINPKIKKS